MSINLIARRYVHFRFDLILCCKRFDYLCGVQVGIKKMLHLIWHKDHSSTSEDGKELKGVRPRLLECYRNLYFDPLPDMEPKQQVNRIAKNMIE